MQKNTKLILSSAIFILIIIIDQLSKHIIRSSLPVYGSINVAGIYLQIVHLENTGIAFGFFKGMNIVMIFAVVAIICLLIFMKDKIISQGTKLSEYALVIVVSGAAGNLIDRIFRGRITDFIEVGMQNWRFPAFNLADSCITVGGILLAVTFLFKKRA